MDPEQIPNGGPVPRGPSGRRSRSRTTAPVEMYTEDERAAWAAATTRVHESRRGPARWAQRLWRLGRNVVTDLRYGRFLGGGASTRYRELGAHPIGNSDYQVMRAVFEGRIRDGDVLLDVGSGRGRVLNHWLGLKRDVTIVGIEIDPDVAAQTRRRLARFPEVTILTGDATDVLPAEASLLYLFNPFNADVMKRFKRSVTERCPSATLLYYYPVYLGVFEDDPAWHIEEIDLSTKLPRGYFAYPLAVVRRTGASDGTALP
jgi:SAM-dependent methyltransferase